MKEEDMVGGRNEEDAGTRTSGGRFLVGRRR